MMNEAIVEKIKKLQALAERAGSEAEAANAAARVAELCRKHNIELGAIAIEREEKTASEGEGPVKPGFWEAHHTGLSSACCALFEVACYKRSLHKPKGLKTQNGNQVVFYGLKANVEAAKMTFCYLDATVEALMMGAYRAGKIKGERASCRAFRMGAANRILEMAKQHARSQKEQVAGSTEMTAIVRVSDSLIKAHRTKLNLSQGSRPAGAGNQNAYAEGYVAGGKVDIHGARTSRMLS